MHVVRLNHPSGSPRELLHLVSTFQIKTDTKWLLRMARYLDPTSFRLSAACFYDGGPIRDRLEAVGVRTYNLSVRDEHDPRAVLRARRLIDGIGCEIVHTHLLRADLYGGTAARWAGVPAIVSTAYAMGPYCRSRRRRSDRFLDATCARLPTHVVAVSGAVRRDCIRRLHMDPERITVIHTGVAPPDSVDPARTAELRARWGAGSGTPLVVTVARLSYEKGIDTLIAAAAVLKTALPGVRVVVVGDGPDRSALEGRIRERGLLDVVRLAGFEADVWPVLTAADVVCLPSKSEGMPNVLLEAMAVGRPIIATAVGGMPEAIASEENGLLVGAGDPQRLAEAIARLLRDPPGARRLGEAARRTVEQRFLARDVVARYGRLYHDLLSARRPQHGVLATAG